MKQTITLPFNPLTQKKDAFVIKMTPPMARHILKHHNNDNRELKQSQVNKISASVATNGWLFDGYACCFNVEGNITEKQHGLTHISRDPDDTAEYDVVIVTGVVLDAFSKGACPKPRRPHDEIYRKDKTVKTSQSAALGDIMKRRKGEKFTINTAVRNWNNWKDDIIKGENLCNTFLSETSDYSSQTKTIVGWASLCVNAKWGKEAEDFLDILNDQVNERGDTRLTKDFYQTFKDLSWKMGNEPKLTLMYNMLCTAMDRFLERPDGAIALRFNINNPTNSKCYRKFLA